MKVLVWLTNNYIWIKPNRSSTLYQCMNQSSTGRIGCHLANDKQLSCVGLHAFWYGYKAWKLHPSNASMSHCTRKLLPFLDSNSIISHTVESVLLLLVYIVKMTFFFFFAKKILDGNLRFKFKPNTGLYLYIAVACKKGEERKIGFTNQGGNKLQSIFLLYFVEHTIYVFYINLEYIFFF